MDGGAWWAAVHGVPKSWTQLSDFTFTHWRRKWQPTPVFLPGESQGRGRLVGCRLWGRTELDTTEATQQQQQQSFCNNCDAITVMHYCPLLDKRGTAWFVKSKLNEVWKYWWCC